MSKSDAKLLPSAIFVTEYLWPTVETRQNRPSPAMYESLLRQAKQSGELPFKSKGLDLLSDSDSSWQEVKSPFFLGLSGRNPQNFPQGRVARRQSKGPDQRGL
jgi:hypothetical protein